MKLRTVNPHRFIALATLILGITSCQKDTEVLESDFEPQETFSETNGPIKLGNKLENPYSIENMRVAYKNLKESSSGRIVNETELQASHLYLRFLPESDYQLDFLNEDTSLVFFDYPLDYEFEELGDYYHDPSIPDSLPTWQYTVVPIDYKLPNVYFELLDSAYIPPVDEAEENTNGRSSNYDFEFLNLLEEEAFTITGNGSNSANARNCKNYKPSGYIRIGQTGAYSLPLKGVEVRCQNFLKIKNTFTNDVGYYYINKKFRRSARRSVIFSRYEFEIKDGWLSKAKYVRGEKCGSWSVTFDVNSKYAYYSHIFRAAFRYYYQDILGLRRPPKNGVLKTKMGIRAHSGNGDGSVGSHAAHKRFLGNQISIWTRTRTPSYTYGTTIHELAHAAHWAMDKSNYNKGHDIVVESWANGVEWALTTMEYSPYYGTVTENGKYTNVVIDMIDGFSSSNHNDGFEDAKKDNVTGYSIREIEDALKGQKTWNGWKNNIKNKYPNNATKNNLDVLFNAWL